MSDARKLKDDAAAAAAKGRYRKAAELYEQITRIEPDDGQWPHRAGEAWKRAGDRNAAADSLSTAADVYARTGFFLKAISVAKMLLELDPGRTDTQAMLAALYARRDGRADGGGQPPLRGGVPVLPRPSSPPLSSLSSSPRSAPPLPLSIELPPDPLPPPPSHGARPPAFGGGAPPLRGGIPMPPRLDERPSARPGPPPQQQPLAPRAASFDAIELPDFSASVAEPDRAFEHVAAEPEPLPVEIIPVDFTPPPAAPPSAAARTNGAGPAPLGLERDTPLNLRIPGARISQSFRIPTAAFEIPIDESAMELPAAPRHLPEIPLFSSLDEERLHRLIQRATVVRCQPGHVVVRQGERGESLFVVVHGTMAVRVEGVAEPVAHLVEGQFFGELALLSSEPRSATVVAETDAEVIEIRRDVVWELIEESPDVLPVLLRFFRDRLIERLIATSPLFAPFTGDESRQLAERFQFLELTAGSQLVREGERAEGLYILLLGRCEVHMSRAGGTVATIGPGELVGEISLLTRGPATATVTTETPVWALAMPRSVFQEVILTHPQVLIYVNDVAEKRRSADATRIDMI